MPLSLVTDARRTLRRSNLAKPVRHFKRRDKSVSYDCGHKRVTIRSSNQLNSLLAVWLYLLLTESVLAAMPHGHSGRWQRRALAPNVQLPKREHYDGYQDEDGAGYNRLGNPVKHYGRWEQRATFGDGRPFYGPLKVELGGVCLYHHSASCM